MKIVVDKHIPFLEGVFEPYAEVSYLEGKEIIHEDIFDADALVVRTRTKCDAELLRGSSVKVIATATIGMDHIDLEYCNRVGIEVHNAAGSNAGGVCQYVFSALYGVASRKGIKLEGQTLGIIGVGNVGRKVEDVALKLGFKVLRCDPPRADIEGEEGFCNLDYLLANSKIVTIHTPLDETTRGMADADFFTLMQPGSIFINSARGEVVDEDALLELLPKFGAVIIDTWNNEPNINEELMHKVDIATPHIAGYSYQGKKNATAAAVQSIAKFFGWEKLYDFVPIGENSDVETQTVTLSDKNQGEITSILQYNYPIFTDDFIFRMRPDNFEKMRSEYNYRREIFII